jgi:hypothetical protein
VDLGVPEVQAEDYASKALKAYRLSDVYASGFEVVQETMIPTIYYFPE